MRRAKSIYEKKNNSRRRSWFNGPFFSMFSSEPPSPERRPSLELNKQRSQSLNEERPSLRPKISRILSRATRRHHKKPSLDTPSVQDTLEHQDTDEENEDKDLLQRHLLKPDDEEADRIQLKNDLVKLAFEGEFSLPFDYRDLDYARILDVGCGPGSWCIDLAQKYPKIEVIGVDNDDMFPLAHVLPPNCQLIVCNVLNGLREFPDESFDVIHIRFMVLSLTTPQYKKVVKDCWRLLKPGGYIEILETDLIIYSAGPLTQKMNNEMLELAINQGYDIREQSSMLTKIVPDEGINKQVKYRSIPIGVWGGRIGVLCRDDMINMLTKFQSAAREHCYKENNTFDQDISVVIREMDQYKSFSNYYFYSAQKPILTPNTSTSNISSINYNANQSISVTIVIIIITKKSQIA
ncbi:hypothetical protein RMCBS344292_05846 [Rhizopus microsporus]|nr:hypothetical protein RMCBS344292_05846 [Rhizopus microsporus]